MTFPQSDHQFLNQLKPIIQRSKKKKKAHICIVLAFLFYFIQSLSMKTLTQLRSVVSRYSADTLLTTNGNLHLVYTEVCSILRYLDHSKAQMVSKSKQ